MASILVPINTLPSTSSVTFKKLESAGIKTFFDLINNFPVRYKDYRNILNIDSAILERGLFNKNENSSTTVSGTVTKTTQRNLKNTLSMQVVTIGDSTGMVDCIWFRQPYILSTLRTGTKITVSGALKRFGSKTQLYVDEYDLAADNGLLLHSGRLVPVYIERRGLSSKILREKIFLVLKLLGDKIPEPLPIDLIKQNMLINEKSAYQLIHFPNNLEDVNIARGRLAFDELFTIQLSSLLVKKEWHTQKAGHPFKIVENKKKIDNFVKELPFKLTSAQEKAVTQVQGDLSKTTPMNRILQGDVGSGKTVVAAIAAYESFLSGLTTLIMAPTEILVLQHFETLKKLFNKSGHPTVSLMTGSLKSKPADIVVGTHAIIAKKRKFSNVGLVVVDEQHRFGVVQRAALKELGVSPHLLTMTATPIPRSVCLTLYGELDLSIIDQMPPNRRTVKTYVVPPHKRVASYEWLMKQIKQEKTQIFIVCPLIEVSQHETMQSVKAVTQEFINLKKIFTNFSLALLHGRMKNQDKQETMNSFRRGKIDILVSTSVVEVGIDVPNASCMVIEGVERYGLAQLHQLRGRVGRGAKQSYCLLFTTDEQKSNERLSFFASTNSGFKLAEYDLMHRGSGELYGLRQHGASDLALASLADSKLVESTRETAERFIKKYKLDDFDELKRRTEKLNTVKITKD